MNKYLAFAVKLTPGGPVVRKDASREVEAQNAETALREAQNHIPLFVGEVLGIALVKSAS